VSGSGQRLRLGRLRRAAPWTAAAALLLVCLGGCRALVGCACGRWLESPDPGRVRLALHLGADPNREWLRKGCTVLHCQAEHGVPQSVRMLAAAGARVDADAGGGTATPLWEATRSDNVATMRALIDVGADPCWQRSGSGASPLHSARSVDACRLLLDHGAGRLVNVRSIPKGLTPLHAAARDAEPGVLVLLLEAGGDPNAIATDGSTPLGWADRWGRRDNRDVLVAHGAGLAVQPKLPPATQTGAAQ
jgi:ankyrin repeat protein